jgi:uncharacterized membrane protein
MPVNHPNCNEETGLARVVDRNIAALLARHRRQEAKRPLADRLADRITGFTGSMRFVYLHAVIFGLWIVINLGWIPGVPRFDPSFVVLAMAASVEAIFLSTFVLITQNRMAEMNSQRANLDLQVSLLAEHEITRLVALVTAMAARLGIEESHDPELGELARDVQPEKVLDRIEESEKSGQNAVPH